MKRKLRKLYVGLMGRGEKAKSTRKAMLAFAIRLMSAAFIYFSHVILARWLGTREFGVYTYVWTWVVILGSISTLGFSMVMVKHLPSYFKHGKLAEFLGLMHLGRIFSFILAVLITVLGILGVYLWGDFSNNVFAIPLILGMVCIPLFALVDVQEGMCRANEWIYLGLIPNYLLRPFFVLIFSAGFIFLYGEIDAQVVMMGCIIGSFFTAIIQLFLIERRIAQKVKKQVKAYLWRPWIGLALPLLLTDSFMLVMANTDIVILEYFMQPEDIAVYYAAVKTTLLVQFIYFAVVLASSNQFAVHWHDEDREKLIKAVNHSVKMTFMPSLVASAGIIAIGYWFLAAYGPDFTRGYPVIVILSMGAILRAATGPTEWMMTMMGQQKIVLWSTGGASLVNIVLNILLIPIWGLEGAATSTAVTMAGSAIYLFFMVRRELKIPIKFAGLV
ncbi:MAG: polysaccharide biosynthesis C-terminal domain-containing protein [OCS116 cluster bacterium]|nr:polysaccharide biosynthesis C-terminal domain-containing protein [OCS116 cluster bacterium]